MKVILVGASGTIGKAIVDELGARHEVVLVGKTRGKHQMDVLEPKSIRKLFESVGHFDALVSAIGKVPFKDFAEMHAADYQAGLADKLMGQVNLVLIGREYIANGGSFTLTSGVLTHDPIRMGTCASMVNGALESFVTAAAIELPRGLRINCVSPGVITEALEGYGPYFRGFEPVPAARAALAYAKSVEGLQTGKTYSVT